METIPPNTQPERLSPFARPTLGAKDDLEYVGIRGERLSLQAFHQLSGVMSGYPFVKVVIERSSQPVVHYMNNAKFQFHADYIAEEILKIPRSELRANIDEFNNEVYLREDRRFFLGIISLHQRPEGHFFALETVEIDNMNLDMIHEFFQAVRSYLDPNLPLFFKPAHHAQEESVLAVDPQTLPRVMNHELFSSAPYIPLNPGATKGRLRVFLSYEDYLAQAATLEWYDIIVMERVPDSIPRISGIINAAHTTPLSHTNVLACGWQIPNAVQLDIMSFIVREKLDRQWVDYQVDLKADHIILTKLDSPGGVERPAWSIQQVRLEEPETKNTPVVTLEHLRRTDRFRYGTKAANLGELRYILTHGSGRLVGFYRIPRPPRQNLLNYLRTQLQVPEKADLDASALEFLRSNIRIPRGIALPFSVQQEFLESSPRIQQTIGKLKMALALNCKEIDTLSIELQKHIRTTRMPDRLRDYIDTQIATYLGGVSSFVIRSSSNAEDLSGFSAAGIYESINHVTSAQNIFESIKEVWASLVSPRSVRLRHEVGISLDDSYMGVIVQEEIKANMGGVLVTTNPLNPTHDFRNVYINVSVKSVQDVVSGSELPLQYLYNTVEGGGRTLSLGTQTHDLDANKKRVLQKLALCGRMLQAHFSEDYTFSTPADIEWAANDHEIFILQLRPYAK